MLLPAEIREALRLTSDVVWPRHSNRGVIDAPERPIAITKVVPTIVLELPKQRASAAIRSEIARSEK